MADLHKWAEDYAEVVTKGNSVSDYGTMERIREAIAEAYVQGFVDADAHNCDNHDCDNRIP